MRLMMSVLSLLRKRQAVFEEEYDEDVLSTTEALLVEEPPTGVSLAQILGDQMKSKEIHNAVIKHVFLQE